MTYLEHAEIACMAALIQHPDWRHRAGDTDGDHQALAEHAICLARTLTRASVIAAGKESIEAAAYSGRKSA